MRALLLIAHGSPRHNATPELVALAQDPGLRDTWDIVETAYLECEAPDIPTAIASAVAAGATEVVGLPWFLHPGRHVVIDIPDTFRSAATQYPHVRFRLADFVGNSGAASELIAHRAWLTLHDRSVSGRPSA